MMRRGTSIGEDIVDKGKIDADAGIRFNQVNTGESSLHNVKAMSLTVLSHFVGRPCLLLPISGFKNRSLGWSERIHPRNLEMVTLFESGRLLSAKVEMSDL